jgi:septal ring factor EnvC (AmiA/AmiB activator)
MAKLFGILSAIVLSFAAFFAHKNSEKYQTEISLRQKEEQSLVNSDKRRSNAKADLASTSKKREDTENTVVKLTKEKVAQDKLNLELRAKIDPKIAEVAANKDKLDVLNKKLEGLPDIESLASVIKTRRAELEELASAISASEATFANLSAESIRLDKVNANYREISSWPALKKSNPALKTRISSIYSDWGFVTLAAGNTAGVISSSNLDVVRDGKTIAKLVVTAVEAGTATASIVPDSLMVDTVLMTGDSVVASK